MILLTPLHQVSLLPKTLLLLTPHNQFVDIHPDSAFNQTDVQILICILRRERCSILYGKILVFVMSTMIFVLVWSLSCIVVCQGYLFLCVHMLLPSSSKISIYPPALCILLRDQLAHYYNSAEHFPLSLHYSILSVCQCEHSLNFISTLPLH